MSWRVALASELTELEWAVWRRIQSGEPRLWSPFFSPEFMLAVAANHSEVRIAILEQAGQIIAFFPFQSDAKAGKPVGRHLSDFHAAIAPADAEWDVQEMLRACGLALWEFNDLLTFQKPFQAYHESKSFSPSIDLRGGYEHYCAERRAAGSEQIKKAGNLARRIEREVGPLSFQLHTPDPDMFNLVIEWRNADFQRHGWGTGLKSASIELLRHIYSMQSPEFAGTLSTLYAGEHLVALHLGMRSQHVLHYWFPTYDVEFGKYSPGILLLLKMAEAACALGVNRIDLGGGIQSYKTRLSNDGAELARGVLYRPSVAAASRFVRRNTSTALRKLSLHSFAKNVIGGVRSRLRRSNK